MSALVRRLPGDLLLYGRVFGLAAGAAWIGMGSLIVAPIAVYLWVSWLFAATGRRPG